MTPQRARITLLIAGALLSWILLSLGLFWFLKPKALDGLTQDSVSLVGQPIAGQSPPQPIRGDFILHSSTGPVRLADLRGRVVLLYFGYTSCPDICPTSLAYIASALDKLTPEERTRVRVLFVSVDPERDDLDRLAKYTAYFHSGIQGVTGSPQEVARAAHLFGASYGRSEASDSAMGYIVYHTGYTYVLDPAGQFAQRLDHGTSPTAILAAIRGDARSRLSPGPSLAGSLEPPRWGFCPPLAGTVVSDLPVEQVKSPTRSIGLAGGGIGSVHALADRVCHARGVSPWARPGLNAAPHRDGFIVNFHRVSSDGGAGGRAFCHGWKPAMESSLA